MIALAISGASFQARWLMRALFTIGKSHWLRVDPTVAHLCRTWMPDSRKKSWLTWSTAAMWNAETSRQREIAPSHVVITLLKYEQHHSRIPKTSPHELRRCFRMFFADRQLCPRESVVALCTMTQNQDKLFRKTIVSHWIRNGKFEQSC